jgi:phage-related protein (TIGR01555 family)
MPTKPKKPINVEGLAAKIHKALIKAQMLSKPAKDYKYPIQPPSLMPGIVPARKKALIGMDYGPSASAYEYARSMVGFGADWVGFPGYPYLAGLSTRAEFRMFAQAYATQLTREWITINSTETAGDETRLKCKELEQMITDINLKGIVKLMAEHDTFYGRAQMFLNLGSQDRSVPLILSPKTIEKKTLRDGVSLEKLIRLSAVEALWTTPSGYNALDPAAPDFYKPYKWFMLGQEVHASRLPTVITRPVSDMLKPAFNFGGISMSQLAEPYVDNWLRTRQSVSDLINNFSIVALQTAMSQILSDPTANADSLFERAELFTLTRSNRGLMLLDKETENLVMLNVPISGLDALQAQAQEQMCSVSHTPSVILLGVAPTGFGNVAEGEIRAYYDWIAAQQESDWRKPIEIVVNILQLIRYGKIDPDIVITFEPLYQMTPKELSDIRKADAEVATALIDRNVIDAQEERERLAANPESGYQGIDVTKVPDNDKLFGDDPDESGEQLENEDVP